MKRDIREVKGNTEWLLAKWYDQHGESYDQSFRVVANGLINILILLRDTLDSIDSWNDSPREHAGIDTGWVRLSTRRPTEADACGGLVLVKHSGSDEVYLHGWSSVTSYQSATHFLPLPQFEEKDEDDYRAFDKWAAGRSAIHEAGDLRNLARKAWGAALKHANK